MSPQRIETLRSILWWTAFALLSAVLVFHFSLIQLANMPMSPLRLNMTGPIARYVSPFFAQRWNFFAPTPLQRDTIVLARARYHDARTAQLVETGWVDVTHPLIEAVKKDRLSPLFLVEVCLSNVANDFDNSLAHNKKATYQRDGKTYIKPFLPPTIDPFNVTIMARTALATLELSFPGQKIEQVQLGLMHWEYPRFTQRHKPVPAKTYAPLTVIDWQPAVWVAPYCCMDERSLRHGA
jgi:hypothetical protein